MRSIKAISKENVHMICSAQVILSPSIALKELLENALDAQASNIEIKIFNQGSKCISVSDNGCGVKKSDFQSLTAKHHTSKISDFTDLDSVSTFGFRGEALSSLCAVGKLSIITRHKEAEIGSRLIFDSNGLISHEKSEPRSIGTTVIFEDIFHNFPVRQKELLKNLKKEYAKIVHILQSYALGVSSGSGVRINASSIKNNNKTETILNINEKGSLKNNIIDIFGPKQFENLLEFSLNLQDFSVKGYISTCQHGQARSKPDRQFFFVNSRPCDLSHASKAINEIFHYYNRYQYPFCVFLITANVQGAIDVNLTPDKRKILIEKEATIWEATKEKLKEIYDQMAPPDIASSTSLIDNYKLTNFYETTIVEKRKSVNDEAKIIILETQNNLEGKVKKAAQEVIVKYDEQTPKAFKKVLTVKFSLEKLKKHQRKEIKTATNTVKARQFLASIQDPKAENELRRHLNKEDFAKADIIGQFNLGFLIVKLLDHDLFIVDQHASDEKYRFEKLCQDSQLLSQKLVCPLELNLDAGKKEILKDHIKEFEKFGFGFTLNSSNNVIKMMQVPRCDKLVLGQNELDEALYLLAEDGDFKLDKYQFSSMRSMFASRACRSAVMIGTALTPSQMDKILKHMSQMNQPWNCPHGRPTLRHLVNLQML